MATELFMRRALGTLRPVDAAGEEALRSMRGDEIVHVTIKRKRNERHHRKFFALLNVVFPHQDTYPTMETFRAAVTCALGFADTVKLPDGRVILVPRSISFANMDQTEFDAFYERAVALICTRIIPGIGRADVEREVSDIIVGRAA